MESVGIYLKKEREAKEISLGEVARLTKISKFYLDYIEKDQFEKLPQGPYIKGYISSYSEQIGGDAGEALKLYDALYKKENPAQETSTNNWDYTENEFPSEPEENPEPSHFFSRLMPAGSLSILRPIAFGSAAIMAAAIFVLAGFGFYHLFLFETKTPATAQSEPSAIQTPEPKTAAAPVDRKQAESPSLAKLATPEKPPSLKREEISTEPELPVTKAKSLLPLGEIATAADFLVEKAYAEDLSEKIPMPEGATGIEPEAPQASINLKVLKASTCSDVQDRVPVGESSVFPSSTQRVFVWNQVKTEEIPTEIRHIYYFEGKKISDVRLKVRSNLWRTWSYKTLPDKTPQGQWRVDIATADGTVLRRLEFTVN